jgi:hypothetical protein
MGNITDNSCGENQNTNFKFINFFFENCFVYEIMWKNIVDRDRPQMTIWRKRIACWITRVTNTHPESVIRFAFSTETMVKQTRLNIPLYVHCLPCYISFQ